MPERSGLPERLQYTLRHCRHRPGSAVLDAASATPSVDFQFAAAVAGFGMLLRESEHRGTLAVDEVLSLARAGLGDDPYGYRRGFLDMVRAYCCLLHGTEPEDRAR